MARRSKSSGSNPNRPMQGPHDRIAAGKPPAPGAQKPPQKQSGVSAPRKR